MMMAGSARISDLGLCCCVDGQLACHFLGRWRRCGLHHPVFCVNKCPCRRIGNVTAGVGGELNDEGAEGRGG